MDGGGIAGDQLRSFVERYEHLQEDIDGLNDDRGDLLKEIARQGFDKKIFKRVIKRRRMGKDQCDEEETLTGLYEQAIEESSRPPRARTREEVVHAKTLV